MPKIHVLDEHLTNMIAAGEVVERPANIVKECVENAIDAHARNIHISVQEGGIERIRIQDDGDGMDRQDAAMAFVRHATSKLQTEEDLFAIRTMGFRGEALASIASVADALLETSDGKEGTRIRCAFGRMEDPEPAQLPKGTVVDVRGLFTKTPARFKYLRKPAYEFSVIADIVNKMALTNPDIRFTLEHNGRKAFVTAGSGNPEEILYQMYGKEVAAAAVKIENRNDDFQISGLAVQPRISRASKYFLYISVNGRLVRSRPIQDAILEAYGPYMPPGRYPICIVDIAADPQMVDVNVHPNKWEVRISKQPELLELIRQTIMDAFDIQLRTVEIKPERLQPKVNAFERQAMQEEEKKPEEPAAGARPADFSFHTESISEQPTLFEAAPKIKETPISYPVPANPVSSEEVHPPLSGRRFLQDLKVIGQLKDSYILCECAEGLAVIDQHAAQERLHYEQLQEKLLQPVSQVQPLMVPLMAEMKPSLLSRLEDINRQCASFGLHLEPFGQGKVILRQLPLWLQDTDAQGFLQDLLDHYEIHEMVDLAKLRKHVTATMACHSSIRFNRPLCQEEMEQVVRDLQSCRQPWHCPHGRPTVITLSDKDLRKEFERG